MPDKIRPSEVSEVLLQQLKGINTSIQFDEVGAVLQVSDGVARIYGLLHAEANELLEFENGVMGVVMNLEEDNVGAVLLGATDLIKEGMIVKRTGRIASIRVSENMLGRVIDPLGVPLDGRGTVGGELFEMPLERKAPGVIYRQPVSEPLQTGIKAIDAMIPIGRGQRELIIGDRQTGKTAIAIDTIINQRSAYEAGKPVYCIYVAIGQKGSTVANIVNTLREKGAMDYTVVVAATAADPAALQYFAPFAGGSHRRIFPRHRPPCLSRIRRPFQTGRSLPRGFAHPAPSVGSRSLPRRHLLPALPPVGTCCQNHQPAGSGRADERPAGKPERKSEMRRFAHGTPYHRDTGRRRVRLHPYECDFHHRRTDIPRN